MQHLNHYLTILHCRISQLKIGLSYLENIMICIQAALNGDFTGIEVSVKVSAEEFVLLLNKIMLGLSSDNINIDFEMYSLFITYCIEGEISEYHIAQLNR